MIARRRDFRAFHSDVDVTKKQVENRYADFRKVDGVMTSFDNTQYDLGTGQPVQTTTVLSQSYNPPDDLSSMARTYKAA